MFDIEKLKVGDVFFSIDEDNNIIRRKKIHKVIDGQDWWRYDVHIRTYSIATHEVLGIVRSTLQGVWIEGGAWDLLAKHHVKTESRGETSSYFITDDEPEHGYFHRKSDATEAMKLLEFEARGA
jgi:hypothetical protein